MNSIHYDPQLRALINELYAVDELLEFAKKEYLRAMPKEQAKEWKHVTGYVFWNAMKDQPSFRDVKTELNTGWAEALKFAEGLK